MIKIIIFLLATLGFFVAKYIRDHKTKQTAMVCPIGLDCHGVVHSDYSKFLGIPVELAGMIYYGFVALAYVIFFFAPRAIFIELSLYITIISFLAFLFSVYLIIVQIFILKKGCSWCIVSAVICALISFLTLGMYLTEMYLS